MNISYEDAMKVITHVKNFDDKRITKVMAIIQSEKIRECIKEIQDKRNEFDIENSSKFNIFTAISDTYHKENLHNDILRDILNPQTPTIGNEKYVRKFIELIGKITSEGGGTLDIPEFSSPISVEREKKRIDIFICDNKKNAIIIESKINNATDQPNQLTRYYQTKKDDGYNVHAIIYLILSPGRKPSRDYNDEVKNKTLVLCGIDKEGEISLARSLLDSVADDIPTTQEQETARVFISQYSDLLKQLGGDKMTEQAREKLFEELFLSGGNAKENIGIVEEIVELWEQRDAILKKRFVTVVHEGHKVLQNMGYTIKRKDDYVYACKSIDEKGKVQLVFGIDNDETCFLGFYEQGMSKEKKNTLVEILNSNDLELITSKECIDDIKGWVTKDWDYDENDDLDYLLQNMSACVNDVVFCLEQVEKTYLKHSEGL